MTTSLLSTHTIILLSPSIYFIVPPVGNRSLSTIKINVDFYIMGGIALRSNGEQNALIIMFFFFKYTIILLSIFFRIIILLSKKQGP